MTIDALAKVALLLLLVLFAGITAASEISFIAANRLKLRRLASGGSKAAKIILKVVEIPERFFGTILVTNNVVGALIAVLVTAMVIHFTGNSGQAELAVATAVASFLIIISEVTAKTLATLYSEKMAMMLAMPMKALIAVFSPVVKIVEVITKAMIRMLGASSERRSALVTEEEIKTIIQAGEEEGVLHKDKSRMLFRILNFSEVVVRNVMAPRKDITSIDINANIDDILDKVQESGYSRIPVYKDNPDNIVGVINMKDLLGLSCNRGLILLQDIIYPATFVSGSKKVPELLKEFQKGHTHIAIVVDDRNKLEGIVTLEDLLEEIVGEIEDESDVRAQQGAKK
ncbi:MAG: hemolysin family protein [Candidatus Omnitrophota bacterium]